MTFDSIERTSPFQNDPNQRARIVSLSVTFASGQLFVFQLFAPSVRANFICYCSCLLISRISQKEKFEKVKTVLKINDKSKNFTVNLIVYVV